MNSFVCNNNVMHSLHTVSFLQFENPVVVGSNEMATVAKKERGKGKERKSKIMCFFVVTQDGAIAIWFAENNLKSCRIRYVSRKMALSVLAFII